MASVRKREWTYKGEAKTAWVCEYTDGTGKRRRKTFEKKKDADRFRDTVTPDILSGTHTPDSETMLIRNVAKKYIEHIEQKVKAGTLGAGTAYLINVAVERNIVPFLGGLHISKLTAEHVAEFSKHMVTSQKLAPATAHVRRIYLLQLEAWAKRRGYTSKLVVPEGCADFPLSRRREIRVPTKEQVGAILDAAQIRTVGRERRTNDSAKIMINLAAFCGLRAGEINALSVPNVDFKNGTILVRQAFDRFGKLKGPKTRSGIRDVPCPPHILDMLAEWMRVHYIDNEDKLILTTKLGTPLCRTTTQRDTWIPTLKKAGLWNGFRQDNLHFHALRHFAGSWWLENGLPITDVSRLLGHASPAVTMHVYAHSLKSLEDRRKALNSYASVLLSAPRDKGATTPANTLIMKAS